MRVEAKHAFVDRIMLPQLTVGINMRRMQALLFEAADPQCVLLDAAVAAVDTSQPTSPSSQGLHDAKHQQQHSRPAAQLQHRPTAVLHDGTEISCKLLVGADGVRSVVGKHLGADKLSFVGQAGYRGIAQFDQPAPVAERTVCQVLTSSHAWRVSDARSALHTLSLCKRCRIHICAHCAELHHLLWDLRIAECVLAHADLWRGLAGRPLPHVEHRGVLVCGVPR